MKKTDQNHYECIIIGAGASGLFFAAGESLSVSSIRGRKLILEKTLRPGQKLLMSGGGMCNITHGGPIKTFIGRYGEDGRKIRTVLYRHSNLELMDMFRKLGVPLAERADGKVFPESMKAKDVLDALLSAAERSGWEIMTGAEVAGIACAAGTTAVTLSDGTELTSDKLVVATGGASYPATGSDGTFFKVLERDLGLQVSPLHPALSPVYVQDFRYEELAGVDFDDIEVKCGGNVSRGPALITHRGFSGPAILHISRYAYPGSDMVINYVPEMSTESMLAKMKEEQPGTNVTAGTYVASLTGLPKAFVNKVIRLPGEKFSTLSYREIQEIVSDITHHIYSVSGTGGWNDAMVTAGGISLDQIDLKTMKIKKDPGADVRFIGEALDICGESGGYNLQFAYSSAMAALEP